MKIVRGRLTINDVQPPNARYDGDCLCVQTTSDGGITWVDTPSADPRHGLQFLKPSLTTGDPQCDAAANMVKWLKDFIDSMVSALASAAEILLIANLALEFFELLFGEAGLLIDLFFEIGSEVTFLGSSALATAFDSTVYDDLLCLFLCAEDSNGTINASSFAVLLTQIDASSINATAKIVLALILNAQGEIGLSNAGAIGSETGDCSGCPSCDWIVEWDVTGGNTHDWQIVLVADSTPRGSFIGGRFIGTHQGGSVCLTLMKALAGLHVTGSSVFIESFHGTGIGNVHRTFDFTDMTNPGVAATVEETDALVSISPAQWQVSSTAEFDVTLGYGMDWICDSNDTGRVNVYKLRLAGTGTPPSDGVFVDSLT